MKGLIKYDLLQIMSGIKGGFIVIYFIFIAALNMINETGSMFSYLFAFISGMFGISTFSYEESSHWNRYVAVLPVNIQQMVLARYASVGICTVMGTVAGIVLGAIAYASGNAGLVVSDWLLLMAEAFLCAALYVEVLIPLLYRFGAEKGRIVMFILFFSLFMALGAFASLADNAVLQILFWNISMEKIVLCTAVIVLILFPVSIWISVRIRKNKEF